MKKIYFCGNGYGCCLEKSSHMISYVDNIPDLEAINELDKADYIVYAKNCAATFERIEYAIEDIIFLLTNRRNYAKIIVTGCIANELNSKWPVIQRLNEVLSRVDYVVREDIEYNVLNIIKSGVITKEDSYFYEKANDSVRARMVIGDGCTNKCTFCKVHYMNFPLKSVPIEVIFETINECIKRGAKCLQLIAPNLTQCGIDLYGKSVLPEILKYIRSLDEIKWILLQELCVGDLRKNEFLLEELATNHKVKCISMHIQTGSERLTKLMNRGYTIEDLRYVVNSIRTGNPDVVLRTALMGAFPTETKKDVQDTIALIKELKYVVETLRIYENSVGVPASRLPQFNEFQKQRRERYYNRLLRNVNKDLFIEINSKDFLIDKVTENSISIFTYDGAEYECPYPVEIEKTLGRRLIPGDELVRKGKLL